MVLLQLLQPRLLWLVHRVCLDAFATEPKINSHILGLRKKSGRKQFLFLSIQRSSESNVWVHAQQTHTHMDVLDAETMEFIWRVFPRLLAVFYCKQKKYEKFSSRPSYTHKFDCSGLFGAYNASTRWFVVGYFVVLNFDLVVEAKFSENFIIFIDIFFASARKRIRHENYLFDFCFGSSPEKRPFSIVLWVVEGEKLIEMFDMILRGGFSSRTIPGQGERGGGAKRLNALLYRR